LKKQIIHFPECSGSEKTGYNVSAIKMFRKWAQRVVNLHLSPFPNSN
jgi:hypothetical protein